MSRPVAGSTFLWGSNMIVGGFSDKRQVRITVEVVDGLDKEGTDNVCFTEKLLLGYLHDEEGLASLVNVEELLRCLEVAHLDEWNEVCVVCANCGLEQPFVGECEIVEGLKVCANCGEIVEGINEGGN